MNFVQIAEFTKLFKNNYPGSISNEQFLCKQMTEKGVHDTFPNVETDLRFYLVLMISNCKGERSFSKLKFIKKQAQRWRKNTE